VYQKYQSASYDLDISGYMMDKIQMFSLIAIMAAVVMTIFSSFIVSSYAQSKNFCVKAGVSQYCSPFVDLCKSFARKLGGTCVSTINNSTTSPPSQFK
jgi:hypothetical protein